MLPKLQEFEDKVMKETFMNDTLSLFLQQQQVASILTGPVSTSNNLQVTQIQKQEINRAQEASTPITVTKGRRLRPSMEVRCV